METIYKYQIEITGSQLVHMPEGAKILCAQMQGSALCLWAEVDTTLAAKPRAIDIYGTGQSMHRRIKDQCRYIGTVQQGSFAWHVYEYTGTIYL